MGADKVKRLWIFLIAAVVVEGIAIPISSGRWPSWLMDGMIAVAVIYGGFLALRGWRKQAKLEIPPAMGGKVVRSRHWRLF